MLQFTVPPWFGKRGTVEQALKTRRAAVPYISRNTIAAAWEASLRAFPGLGPHRYDSESMGLTCIEIEDVVLRIVHPDRNPRVSRLFPDADFSVTHFVSKLTPDQLADGPIELPDASVTRRLFHWPQPHGETINQLETVVELLRQSSGSRRALMSFWDPSQDLTATAPVSSCLAYVRIRGQTLRISVTARSVDAWNGAIPIMAAFSRLQELIATQLDVAVGEMRFNALSYHIYETDVPYVAKLFDWNTR